MKTQEEVQARLNEVLAETNWIHNDDSRMSADNRRLEELKGMRKMLEWMIEK